jgi:hypothetical protein
MSVVRGNPLFRPRAARSSLDLGVLQPVFPGSKPLSRVYLLAPESKGEELAERFGIEFNKHGANFQLDAGVELARIPAELLPFYARPQVAPFLNDLAPANSWGGSLATLLSSSSMQTFAAAASRKFGAKCYLCGAPRLTPKTPPHHARPWWGYAEPANGEAFGRQYLLALTPMCRDCVDMLQLARGDDAARLESVLTRLAAVFRMKEAEVREYHGLVVQRWERHSRYMWAVDLSRVFGDATVELQAAWQHSSDSGHEQPVLYRAGSTNSQPASLLLRGVRYTLNSSHREHFFR